MTDSPPGQLQHCMYCLSHTISLHQLSWYACLPPPKKKVPHIGFDPEPCHIKKKCLIPDSLLKQWQLVQSLIHHF